MTPRFALRTIVERLDFDRADAETVDDTGFDGTAILYPADARVDYRTGEVTRATVIVRADRPENLTRAIRLHEAREAARRASRRA